MRPGVWWLVGLAGALAAVLATAGFLAPHDDPTGRPDAVVVLGGGSPARADLGIELADELDAELVLSFTAGRHARQAGRYCGVDARCFEPEPLSTAGEAREVRDLSAAAGWDEILVVTTDFHTSRSRLLFEQCLDDGAVGVVGVPHAAPWPVRAYSYAREAAATLAGITVRRAC